MLRWAQATNEVSIVKVLGLNNPSDMCTKTNLPSDFNHHIDAVMCRGSVLPPRLQGSFSTRESKNRKPNLTGAAVWEANKAQAATEEVSKQVQFKSKNMAPDRVGDTSWQAEKTQDVDGEDIRFPSKL